MAPPATIEDRKNEIGITGDHHREASMLGISRPATERARGIV
jgi:hypothetical protein